jgi:hypothetical protein
MCTSRQCLFDKGTVSAGIDFDLRVWFHWIDFRPWLGNGSEHIIISLLNFVKEFKF